MERLLKAESGKQKAERARKKAALIVGHGSRRRGFQAAMKKVAASLLKGSAYVRVDCAYLEVNRPSILEGIERLVKQGATEVRVLPYFLLTGKHVTRDIPEIISAARRRFRDRAKIILCPYMGFDKKLVLLAKQRLRGK